MIAPLLAALLVVSAPCPRSVEVRTGEIVPCDGDLNPSAAMRKLFEEMDGLRLVIAELDDNVTACAADLGQCRVDRAVEETRAASDLSACHARAESCEARPIEPSGMALGEALWRVGLPSLAVGILIGVLAVTLSD